MKIYISDVAKMIDHSILNTVYTYGVLKDQCAAAKKWKVP
jgi:hypothetical protein